MEKNNNMSNNTKNTQKKQRMDRKLYCDIWCHIITTNNIDLNKYSSILTSKDIKKCQETWKGAKNQFEPRLLCKMDNKKSRPQNFIDNNICILSTRNDTYTLIKENIYIPLTKYHSVGNIISNQTDCLLLDIGESETSMLDKLKYNNILDIIIGEKIKYGPILGGRHRCNFDAFINSNPISIQGSQFETDGCYQTENYICVVEAKYGIECDNFNIRQLYYPFRYISKVIGVQKKIICLFIYKDKRNFIHIYKFKWNNIEDILDIENIGYYHYYDPQMPSIHKMKVDQLRTALRDLGLDETGKKDVLVARLTASSTPTSPPHYNQL